MLDSVATLVTGRGGRSEEGPNSFLLRSGTLDAVVVSSAWHWMDTDQTVAEVGRVLRSGGVFGVIRNGPDRPVGWVTELLGARGRVAG